jgi:pyruvate formate lyase activating enzyme
VPLHFTAFHPDYKMTDLPATPPSTLRRAREIARRAGLRHVYTGNVHDPEGGTTYCPSCAAPVIVRDWYEILDYRLTAAGDCSACGAKIHGRFSADVERHGRRRTRLRINP